MKQTTVEVGPGDVVTVDKLFGPTIFAPLRITANVERGWVVERQRADSGEWVEWCVVPAQLDDEFAEEGDGT